MDSMIREFALQLLRRLQSRPKSAKYEDVHMNGEHDEHMEDGQLPQEDIIQTPYLPEQLELPANNAQVLQHLELLFALSTKVPEFLDEYVHSRISEIPANCILGCSLLTAEWMRACRRQYNSS